MPSMNVKNVAPVALTAAVIGGAAGVGSVAVFGVGGKDNPTTVVQQAPISTGTVHNASESGLTARDLYRRDAPGVVYVRADVVQQSQSSVFDFGVPQQQRGTSTGSGFVLDKNGYV